MSSKTNHLGRREFITLADSAAAVLPIADYISEIKAAAEKAQSQTAYVHEITMCHNEN